MRARERDLSLQAGALAHRLEYAEAEVARLEEVEATLAKVYAGGWWRLRSRLLAWRGRASRLLGRRA